MNERRVGSKWRERIFDFALGVLLSGAISAFTIYVRVSNIETRVARIEKTLETITTITVRGNP